MPVCGVLAHRFISILNCKDSFIDCRIQVIRLLNVQAHSAYERGQYDEAAFNFLLLAEAGHEVLKFIELCYTRFRLRILENFL